MADADQETWWRTSKALAVAALGGAAILGFLFFVVSGLIADGVALGFPLGYFFAAIATPIILVLIVFWFANRQDEIDRRHGLSED